MNARGRVRSPAQITLTDVGLTYDGTPVLRGLGLTVGPHDRVAVVGENGRGKTSLLRILAGSLAPSTGTVRRVGSIAVAEQELSVADARTVREAATESIAESLAALRELEAAGQAVAAEAAGAADRYATAMAAVEALDAWNAERRVAVALEALGAHHDPSTALASLSVGQRHRIRLATLLGGDAEILLLDEPTNHLDAAALDFLTTGLRERRGGVVLVSHDRALLGDVAQTFVDLDPSEDGRPAVSGGGLAGYREAKRAARARWEQAYAREQAERERLEADLTAAVTVPEPPLRLRFPDLPGVEGEPVIRADGVTVAGRLPEPVTVDVPGGSRLVVTGPNGAGKSTLLGLLAGDLGPTTGVVSWVGEARTGWLRQESEFPAGLRAAEAFRRSQPRIALSELGLLGRREADQWVVDLSTGQRRRLDLAIVLAQYPEVLLLDEPTNHLSMDLVDELTAELRATRAAVVVVTHDRQLLRDLSDWPQLRLVVG